MIKFQGDSIVDDMAFIVENDVLVHSLLQQIKKHDNITLQNGSKIEAVQLATATQNLGYVTLQTGEEYSCNLMVSRLFYLILNIYFAILCLVESYIVSL